MRILVVSNLYPPFAVGGYERQCFHMVTSLRARGHHVRVLTSAPRVPATGAEFDDSDVVRALRVSEMFSHDRYWSAAPLTRTLTDAAGNFVDAANVYWLGHEIDRMAPDVAYVWNLHGIGGVALLASLEYRGLPWVCHLCDAVPKLLCELDWRPVPALADAFGRQLGGAWIAMSSRLVDEIQRTGPALGGSIDLLPGCLPDDWAPAEAPPYRPGQTLRVVYVGTVAEFKGAGVLIDAITALRDEGIDEVTLDLSGPIRDPHLQERVAARGLGDRVIFHGAEPQRFTLDRLSEHHVVAFPTHEREPFRVAPLEGAAAGCVPVISESCGIAEWLVHGVHCVKAAPTARAFTAVLRSMIAGDLDLEPLKRRARAAALRDFRASRMAGDVERILMRTAAQGQGISGSTLAAHRAALLAEHVVGAAVQE